MAFGSYVPGLGQSDPDNYVTVTLTIAAGGHYTLDFALKEKGLWHAANGNWSRQIPNSTPYAPPSTDSGTYRFSGRNEVALYDQFGVSNWQRRS